MSAGEVLPSVTTAISVVVDSAIVGSDALLKTCYWFSRDFHHEINRLGDHSVQVHLLPKKSATAETIAQAKEDFLNTAIDFELRSRVEAKTSKIRELILAKAFSESGVLEDQPVGVFADSVEEHNPDGLFKILSSGDF
jgi:His-Xaa-Ser system protein HxsD